MNDIANVLPIQAAAGEKTGSIMLERSPDNAGDHRTGNHPLGVAPITVPLVALDDLLTQQLKVGFALTDAQGYDQRVIQGMKEVIGATHPQFMTEFWPMGIVSVGDDPDDVLNSYRSVGYRVLMMPDEDVTSLSAEEVPAKATGGKADVTLLLKHERTCMSARAAYRSTAALPERHSRRVVRRSDG